MNRIMGKNKGRGRPKKNTLIISAQAPEAPPPILVKSKSMHPALLSSDILPKKLVMSPCLDNDIQMKELESQNDNNVTFYEEKIAELNQKLASYEQKYTFTCQVCLEQKDVKHLASIDSCVNHHFCC